MAMADIEEGQGRSESAPCFDFYACNQWNCTPKMKMQSCCGTIMTVVLGVVAYVIGTSIFVDVPYDSWGIGYNVRSGRISPEVLEPGRHHLGFNMKVHTFPRTNTFFEFSNRGGTSPIVVRAADRYTVQLDCSVQLALNKDQLHQIYARYKHNINYNLGELIRSEITSEANHYTAETYFRNRTLVEEAMRDRLENGLKTMYATLTGFQFRHIILPASTEEMIQKVVMTQQEATTMDIRLSLDKLYAQGNITVIGLENVRTTMLREYEMETLVNLKSLEQTQDVMASKTAGMVKKLQTDIQTNHTLYLEKTRQLEEEIMMEKTVVEQDTQKAIDTINIEADTQLQLYRQETDQQKASLDADIASIEKETERRVAEYEAETYSMVQERKDALQKEKASVEAKMAVIIDQARDLARSGAQQAYMDAYAGLPPWLFVWHHMVNSTVGKATMTDMTTPKFVQLESLNDAENASAA